MLSFLILVMSRDQYQTGSMLHYEGRRSRI
jgi:hypothetical protein